MHFVALVPLWLAIIFVVVVSVAKVLLLVAAGTIALAGWGIYCLFKPEQKNRPTRSKQKTRNS